MGTIRERWSVLAGMLLLLAAGNLAANRDAPVREIVTFIFLACSAAVYVLLEHAGWIRLLYLPEQLDEQAGANKVENGRSTGIFVFVLVSAIFVIYVDLTGGGRSPLYGTLCFPILLAGLRYGAFAALAISILFAANCIEPEFVKAGFALSSASAALSFPLAALFGALLRTRFVTGFRTGTDRITELVTLMDVSKMLETAIDLDTTVNLLLINAERIVHADISAVYLLEAGSPFLRLAAPFSDENKSELSPVLSIKALESGSWRLSMDDVCRVQRDPTFARFSDIIPLPETVSGDAMYASLIGSEGVLGLLYVARSKSRPRFEARDEATLRLFTSHVSMPLQKARYQENLSALAYRDQMTDLSNFRYFEQRLTEELVRAKRYQQKVTILLLDIDHFKKFNDIYGHSAGDSLLKQFGYVLKECLRESDLPVRYGGEEFVVICPGISSLEARIVAERARATFEDTEFDLGESLLGESAKARITVSIGFATFPNHATEYGELVRQADRALYAAKERGRNTVVSCDDIPTVDETIAARSVA
jgi:diguanylate cyclase (GGDEF)-like protein